MFTAICPGCGMYKTEKAVRITGNKGESTCAECGHVHEFRAMPLYVVIGASGTGKSTIALHMQQTQQEVLALDGDLLWRSEFAGGELRAYFDMWMQMALNMTQCGKPVMLFMGGLKEDYLESGYAKYFAAVNVLGLYAEEDDLAERLRARPAWRGSAKEEFIENMKKYNATLREYKTTLCTSGRSVAECAQRLMEWSIAEKEK